MERRTFLKGIAAVTEGFLLLPGVGKINMLTLAPERLAMRQETIDDKINIVKEQIETFFPVEVTLEGKKKELEYEYLKGLLHVLIKTGGRLGNNLVSPKAADGKLQVIFSTDPESSKYGTGATYFDITPGNQHQLRFWPSENFLSYPNKEVMIRRFIAHEFSHSLQAILYDFADIAEESRQQYPNGLVSAIKSPMEEIGFLYTGNPEDIKNKPPWEVPFDTPEGLVETLIASDPQGAYRLDNKTPTNPKNTAEINAEILMRYLLEEEFRDYFEQFPQHKQMCEGMIAKIKSLQEEKRVDCRCEIAKL